MTTPDAELPRPRTLAEKIDRLFRTVHRRGHEEYSYDDVAVGIRQRGGPTISATYVWHLRKGLRDNPTKRHLEALADFFGVPPSYFFDEAASRRIEQQLELLAAIRDAGVQHLALRAVGLSSDSLAAITQMIEIARKVEGLSDHDADIPGKPGTSAGEDVLTKWDSARIVE